MTEETEEFPLNEKLEESIQKKTMDAYDIAYKECNTTFFWDEGNQEVVDRELKKNLTQEEKQYRKEKDEYSTAKTMKMLSDMEKESEKSFNDHTMKNFQNHLAYVGQHQQEQKEYRENVAKTAESTAKIAENTTKQRKAVIIASAISLVIGLIIATISPLILPFIKYLWFLIPTW